MSTVCAEPSPVKASRKPRKPAEPVHGVCRWMIPPIELKDFASGVLAIGDTEYIVTLPADRSGARLTKAEGGRDVYHVDLAAGSCDCDDAKYRPERPGGCKHQAAVRAAVAVLPGRQKYTACPRCQAYCDGGQLCDQCRQEDDYHSACEQLAEMEAAGLDAFAGSPDEVAA